MVTRPPRAQRRPEDIPGDELLVYDMAFQRWQHVPWEKVLEEAALILKLAVWMVTTGTHAKP